MKKKLILGLLVFVALFTITGCGSKKDESSNNSGNNNNESNNSSQKVASTLTCTYKSDSYEKTMTVNFDKDEMILDGTTVTVYAKESDAKDNYKYIEESVQKGGLLNAKLEDKTIAEYFDIDSTSLSGIGYTKAERNKNNLIRYAENLDFECK